MSAALDFQGIAALVIFCLSILAVLLLVLWPAHVPLLLPAFKDRRCRLEAVRVPLSFCWMPVVGVALMLICQCMNWPDVGRGLKGDDKLQPYGIMILFMSLAYIGSSLDATGVFAWLALKSTYAAKNNGRVLFLFYYLLSTGITTCMSNDICIITLTPIICYFANAADLDPVPYLIALYAAANICSTLLYIGNPTNIIVAQAYSMTFIGYMKWSVLPALASTAVGYAMLWFQFRNQIPAKVDLPLLDPSRLLTDKLGAVLGSINAVCCIALLAAASALGWRLWIITIVCAGIHMGYNFYALVLRKLLVPRENELPCSSGVPAVLLQPEQVLFTPMAAGKKLSVPGEEPPAVVQQPEQPLATPLVTPDVAVAHGLQSEDPSVFVMDMDIASGVQPGDPSMPVVMVDMGAASGLQPEGSSMPDELAYTGGLRTAAIGTNQLKLEGDSNIKTGGEHAVCDHKAGESGPEEEDPVERILGGRRASFVTLITNLPWEVVPFALGMFVLVEGLSVQGWIDTFADGLGSQSQSLSAAVWLIGSVAFGLCNLVNNQPLTILMTRILLNPVYTAQVSVRAHQAALYALIFASNLGALFTLIGALAGIMWSNIIRRCAPRVEMSYLRFIKLIAPTGFACMMMATLWLWLEFAVFPDKSFG